MTSFFNWTICRWKRFWENLHGDDGDEEEWEGETKGNCFQTLLTARKASACVLFGFTLHKAPFFILILNGRTAIAFKILIQLLWIVLRKYSEVEKRNEMHMKLIYLHKSTLTTSTNRVEVIAWESKKKFLQVKLFRGIRTHEAFLNKQIVQQRKLTSDRLIAMNSCLVRESEIKEINYVFEHIEYIPS